MRATKKQNGYTMTETLIVLAVTGAMFTATVLLVSGQIARYRFKDSAYNAQQRVQAALNDVQTGYFALLEDQAGCGGASNAAGDSDCVYVGKRINVAANGSITATPLVQDITDGTPIGRNINTLTAVAADTSQMPSGVDYTKAAEVYVLFNNYSTGAVTNYTGGAQSVGTYITNGNTITSPPAAPAVNTNANKQVLCLQDGNRKAVIKIGVGGGMAVDLSYQPTAAECP